MDAIYRLGCELQAAWNANVTDHECAIGLYSLTKSFLFQIDQRPEPQSLC